MSAPGPGLHEGVTYREYAQWPYLNGTALFSGKTPRHIKAVLDGKAEDDDTPDLRFGRALHVRLCEPKLYSKEILISQPCGSTLKSGARKGEQCGSLGRYHFNGTWWCGSHKMNEATEPENYISQAEAARIEEIAEEVRQDDVIRLLRQKGGFEASGVFEYRGVMMKVRMDKVIPRQPMKSYAAIVDIKTTQWGSGDDDKFNYAIRKFNYHTKAALYCEFYQWFYGEPPSFIWVVIEKEYPYCLNKIEADPKWLEIGKLELDRRVDEWKACVESGEYPGYKREVHWVPPPDWLQIAAGVKGPEPIWT